MKLTEPMKAALRSGRDCAVVACDARTEPALIRRGLVHPTESTLTEAGIAALAELDAEDVTPVTVVRRNPGHYTVKTPSGDYDVTNCPADNAMVRQGFPSGPRWMVTNPGQYSADGEFATLADALTSIRDIERHAAKNTTSEPIACPVHRVQLSPGTNKPACPNTHGITEYGVFGDEGSLETYDCAYSAVNRAIEFAAEDSDADYSVHQVCTEHRDEKATVCPECHAESD